jgi:hypothetical protein
MTGSIEYWERQVERTQNGVVQYRALLARARSDKRRFELSRDFHDYCDAHIHATHELAQARWEARRAVEVTA